MQCTPPRNSAEASSHPRFSASRRRIALSSRFSAATVASRFHAASLRFPAFPRRHRDASRGSRARETAVLSPVAITVPSPPRAFSRFPAARLSPSGNPRAQPRSHSCLITVGLAGHSPSPGMPSHESALPPHHRMHASTPSQLLPARRVPLP
ncbi:hypothetical protein E2562_031354 [Oryza meyeriana var. granulata]|uniref:Uncharacterized protein n=1 Tax=Oryza meyeriana var. granulata TaxID=110450 RepID=A0A6G1D8Q9_9ORYZ|nr:hypothetical protein E2562_031354 [Oryza meyeriana var. granulata]